MTAMNVVLERNEVRSTLTLTSTSVTLHERGRVTTPSAATDERRLTWFLRAITRRVKAGARLVPERSATGMSGTEIIEFVARASAVDASFDERALVELAYAREPGAVRPAYYRYATLCSDWENGLVVDAALLDTLEAQVLDATAVAHDEAGPEYPLLRRMRSFVLAQRAIRIEWRGEVERLDEALADAVWAHSVRQEEWTGAVVAAVQRSRDLWREYQTRGDAVFRGLLADLFRGREHIREHFDAVFASQAFRGWSERLEARDLRGIAINHHRLVSLLQERAPPVVSPPVTARAMVQLRALALRKPRDFKLEDVLEYAARAGHVGLLESVLRAGLTSVDALVGDRTLLMRAVHHSQWPLAKRLLELGADVGVMTEHRRTALFFFSVGEFDRGMPWDFEAAVPLLDAMVTRGANVNHVDALGHTPLFMPSWCGYRNTVRLLLARGADVNHRDLEGRTPWDHAKGESQREVMTLLEKAGAVVSRPKAKANGLPLRRLRQALVTAGGPFAREAGKALGRIRGQDVIDASEAEAVFRDLQPDAQLALIHAIGALGLPATKVTRPPAGIVIGDLTLPGGFDFSWPLFVTGDLTVQGVLEDTGPDSCLVVGGTVRCTACYTSGTMTIGGDLDAGALVYGSYNDDVLFVHGTIRADVVVEDDHTIDGVVEAKVHVLRDGFDASSEALRAQLVPGAFKAGALSCAAMLSLVAKGKPLVRAR